MTTRQRIVCFVPALLALALSGPTLRAQSAEFDERPVPVKAVAPDYPEEMLKEQVSGIVTVKLLIDENGDVLERAVSKSTRQEFEPAALAAVEKWKFRPARKAGVAVRARITLPIKFNFEG